jgi:hypothetical protein
LVLILSIEIILLHKLLPIFRGNRAYRMGIITDSGFSMFFFLVSDSCVIFPDMQSADRLQGWNCLWNRSCPTCSHSSGFQSWLWEFSLDHEHLTNTDWSSQESRWGLRKPFQPRKHWSSRLRGLPCSLVTNFHLLCHLGWKVSVPSFVPSWSKEQSLLFAPTLLSSLSQNRVFWLCKLKLHYFSL